MDYPELRPENEIDMIRGKLLFNGASMAEVHDFLRYASVLESLLDEASDEDFFGTEGWRHRVGWND